MWTLKVGVPGRQFMTRSQKASAGEKAASLPRDKSRKYSYSHRRAGDIVAVGAMENYLQRIADRYLRIDSLEVVVDAIAHLGGSPPESSSPWAVEAFEELLAVARDLQRSFRPHGHYRVSACAWARPARCAVVVGPERE
jgi:hypothetical protein